MKTTAIYPKTVRMFLVVGMLVIAACSGGEQTVIGTVEKTDKGHVLKVDDGETTYRLVENSDMATMVGKTIEVTGTVMERTAGRTISVSRFAVVGEDASGTPKQ